MTALAFQFWGKSGADDAWHPVVLHMLDVAAVARTLILSGWRPPRLDAQASADTLAALVALHDIGKFTRPFQAKRPDLWPRALGDLDPRLVPPVPRHDSAGYEILSTDLSDTIAPLSACGRVPWGLLRAVTGHHGRPPEPPPSERAATGLSAEQGVYCQTCHRAAELAIEMVRCAISPPPLPALDQTTTTTVTWWLAGLAMVSDWVGSSTRWFPYRPAQTGQSLILRDYWHEALDRARRAVREAGIGPSPADRRTGLRVLFPQLPEPTPLQAWVEQVALPQGTFLCIIEDATGAGKTEAAMVLAHRLLASGRAAGVYFALPTMATASAMYGRLASAYRRLFAHDARPSLVLAHSGSLLDRNFRGTILAPVSEPAGAGDDPADEPAGAQCAAWIADDRRKAFLADVGVGTVDQALLAVLPARHAPMRLLGLSRRVLIIDEVHAYDSYMSAEIERLLEFHARMGGSAILLSATLPRRTREKLVGAFRAGLGDVSGAASGADSARDAPYPLATICSREGVAAQPLDLLGRLRRTVTVERIGSLEDAAARVRDAAGRGAAVAWVRNAVDDVLETAESLQRAGLEPIVFHARMAMGDRLAVEQGVLMTFGPQSSPAQRKGRVVVATQVIEQSLDLDFDLLVTDLAPVDLLIQRAGRLWRHARDARPLGEARLLVVSPDPGGEIGADWVRALLPRTAAVYADHTLLWRSARALLGTATLRTPDDIRRLVEAAYDLADAEPVPPALARNLDRAQGKENAARSFAEMNLLGFSSAYLRCGLLWDPDTRVRTRIEDVPHATIRLARAEGGQLVPWCDDPDPWRAWALSEVAVPTRRLEVLGAPLAGAGPCAEARAGWARWQQHIPVAVLTPSPDGRGFTVQVEGVPTDWRYSRCHGLRFGRDDGPEERGTRPAGRAARR